MTVALENFLPLQDVIARAEAWTRSLNAQRSEMNGKRAEEMAASVEYIVSVGISLGELLPLAWRVTFDNLFRPGAESWTTPKEFEAVRREVKRLFFTAREAMSISGQVAEALQARTAGTAAGMARLLAAIEAARQLEEAVFRDWPSFERPQQTLPIQGQPQQTLPSEGKPQQQLPVDESLAEALKITVEEARMRLDARRRELNAGRG